MSVVSELKVFEAQGRASNVHEKKSGQNVFLSTSIILSKVLFFSLDLWYL